MSTVNVALQTAFDHAACTYRWLCGRRLGSREWRRIAEEVDSARSLFRTRGWLANPASYHVTPPRLTNPTFTSRRSRGRDFVHMKFESGYVPHIGEPGRDRWRSYASNWTSHAWVLRHPEPQRPWMICIHGYGMGFPFLDFEAFPLHELHDRLGCNVIIPVLPLHGQRRVGRISGERFLDGDILDTVHAEACAVWELRRLLGWIREQEASAIGVYGLSLGGYNAALLASLEADLACVVGGIAAVDFLRLARLHSRATSVRSAERTGMCWPHVEEVLSVIAPLAMRPRVARDRLFLFAGSCDRIVPHDQTLDLWQHWGRPHLGWYGGGHFSFRWAPAARRMLLNAVERTMLEPPAQNVAA
jgi:hypothetical protein